MNDTFNLAEIHGSESACTCDSYRVQPVFRLLSFLANVDVWGLIEISFIEPNL